MKTSESSNSSIPSPSELNPTPTPTPALTKAFILSTASSIIKQYHPDITSAYLFGSYAKGTARAESDVDIALFTDTKGSAMLTAVGGVFLDLERAFKGKKIDLSICPPKNSDFLQRLEKYWVKIDLGDISTATEKDRELTHRPFIRSDSQIYRPWLCQLKAKELLKYKKLGDDAGGYKSMDKVYEHAICDCINRLGDSVKKVELGFGMQIVKDWSAFRAITAHGCHELDLGKVWDELVDDTARLKLHAKKSWFE